MKKSLAALAVLGAFGASAMAANVSLYGVVDTGLMYNYNKVEDSTGSVDSNILKMKSGINAGSRFGLKGEEDLGNGLVVGFKLENQFNNDDGSLVENRLFRREAALYVKGDFGTLAMGRMGGVGSSAGTYDLVYSIGDAFDGGDNDVAPKIMSARYDNMVTYQTPKYAGLQATVQYSFQTDSVKTAAYTPGVEGESSSDRYASFALTGEYGALNFVAAYEFLNDTSWNAVDELPILDANDVNAYHLGANYDCGFAKTFVLAQYADADNLKGYGLNLGTQFQAVGGDVTVGLFYNNFEENGSAPKFDEDYYGVSARYEYPLSKRTTLYTGAGYGYDEYKTEADKTKTTLVQAYVGLTHTF